MTSASGKYSDNKVTYKQAKPAVTMSKSPITPQQPNVSHVRESVSDFVLQPKLLSSPVRDMSPLSNKQKKLKKAVEQFM